MRRISAYGPPAMVLLACLAVLFLTPMVVRSAGLTQTQAKITLARTQIEGDDILERVDRAVTAIAESVAPSVVHIDVRSSWDREGQEGEGRFGNARSSGSGWVYDVAGHIVTNAHVVRGAERMTVQFIDGRLVDAELVGIDPFTDIAVIKADSTARVFPARRDTGHIPLQGERVFAFGSPFGFKFSMSEGIVSGLGRDPMNSIEFGGFTNFIQTDAAVNPGNSGGPLVSVRGGVMGMNVAIATARDGGSGLDSAGGDSAGISFAIPLPTIETVVNQIINEGTVSRGYLGVRIGQPVGFDTPEGAYRRGIQVFIADEEQDGPASRAGIQSGDIVTAVAGQPVPEQKLFMSVVGTIPASESVDIELYRDGEAMTVPVFLGELPDHVLGARARSSIQYQLGIIVERREPVLYRVFDSSPAERAGLSSGQRVLSVDGQPVNTSDDIFTHLTAGGLLTANAVTMRVRDSEDDGGAERTIEVKLGR